LIKGHESVLEEINRRRRKGGEGHIRKRNETKKRERAREKKKQGS
jgi:hypothetical protein